MKKNKLIVFFIFISSNILYSQQEDPTNYRKDKLDKIENLFTTPDVTQLHRSTFFDNNFYTGKIDLKIPIYDINYGEMSMPIFLTYNSSGIKVDDIASNVGMGWNLSAGGSIIRSIKDIEDNVYKLGYYGLNDWDLGWITYSFPSKVGFNRSVDEIKSFNESAYFSNSYLELSTIDSSPDIYNISTNNINSSFYLEKEQSTNIHYPKQLSGKELVFDNSQRISLNKGNKFLEPLGFDNRIIKGIENMHKHVQIGNNPLGTPIIIKNSENFATGDFKNFNFTNTDGINYNFKDIDIIETIPNAWLGPNSNYQDQLNVIYPYDYNTYATTWHLSSMKDINNNIILFEYNRFTNPNIYTNRSKSNIVFNSLYTPPSGVRYTNGCDYAIIPENYNEKFNSQEDYYINRQKNELNIISWGNNKIEFKYLNPRLDNPNEKSLDEIIIKSNNEIIKRISFVYSYYRSIDNCTDWKCYRLKLDKIIFKSSNNSKINEYSFEYLDENKLPKVNSSQQDFLGFYNNNGIEQNDINDYKVPTLYFHKNQGKFSILPFQRTDGTFTKVLPGQFSLIPNSFSMTGLLKKVTFPTSGTAEFEYENNSFVFNNQEYISGGARIKRQILNDGVKTRIKYYDYTLNGKTSGVINNIPTYGQIWGFDKYNTDKMSFVIFDKPKNEIELTQGAYVGYSNVKEYELNNGYIEYSFSTANNYPNEDVNHDSDDPYNYVGENLCIEGLFNNSSFPFNAYIDNDVRRGQLLNKKIYNSTNNIIMSELNEYNYMVFNEKLINFRRFINDYNEDYYNKIPTGFTLKYRNKLRIERNLLSKQETKEYLDGGVITNTKEITYDAIYPFVKQKKTKTSKGETLTTEYQYPPDIPSYPHMDKLIAQNRIAEPVITKQKVGDNYVSATYNEYNVFNNIAQKARIFQKKGDSNFTDNDVVLKYDSYDPQGNITQYTLTNGIPVAIIWGYNGQYPIFKAEGVALKDIPQWLIDYITSPSNVGDNTELFTRLNYQRNEPYFKNAMVTGYIYKPLVGVTQIIQPNGISETYNYDYANRLQSIVNNRGEIIKTFEYNYKQP